MHVHSYSVAFILSRNMDKRIFSIAPKGHIIYFRFWQLLNTDVLSCVSLRTIRMTLTQLLNDFGGIHREAILQTP